MAEPGKPNKFVTQISDAQPLESCFVSEPPPDAETFMLAALAIREQAKTPRQASAALAALAEMAGGEGEEEE